MWKSSRPTIQREATAIRSLIRDRLNIIFDNPETPREQPAITSAYFGNHSIRTRDWRLIVYEDGAKELYDHRNDQDEFHNLAADPAHQETIERLSQWLPQNAAPEFRKVSERDKTRAN